MRIVKVEGIFFVTAVFSRQLKPFIIVLDILIADKILVRFGIDFESLVKVLLLIAFRLTLAQEHRCDFVFSLGKLWYLKNFISFDFFKFFPNFL